MDRLFYVYCFCLHFVSWLPFHESETLHVFYKQRWILVILCRQLNRLIYWWPSKSKINEVHNYSNVTLYSYRGTFGRISNNHYLNQPGKLSSIHLIKQSYVCHSSYIYTYTNLRDCCSDIWNHIWQLFQFVFCM